MKKIRFIYAGLILILWSLSCDLRREKEWVPLSGETDFQYTNDFVLVDYEFGRSMNLSRLLDIKIDQDENLYLADERREGILKLSPQGTLLKEIGCRGQGPGEFREPSRLFISPHNELYVLDSHARKISKFNDQGDYLATILIREETPSLWTEFFVDFQEHIYFYAYDYTDNNVSQSLIELNAQGIRVRTIASFLEEHLGSKAGLMGGIIHPFTPRVFLSSSGRNLYFGCSAEAQIFSLDEKHGKIQAALIKEKAIPINAKETRYFKKAFRNNPSQLKLPSSRPYYSGFLCDEKERIYLTRTKSILDKTPAVTIEILSKNGDFLYRFRSPFIPRCVQFGKIYLIEHNELNEYRIRKLKIKGYSDWKY